MQMKHRDRVASALHHEAPDRCPMQISFTPEFAARLRARIGQQSGKAHNPHGEATRTISRSAWTRTCS